MSFALQADTSHVIQLSVAPAFILAAIGTTLTVLTNRLARVNDRAENRRDKVREADDENRAVRHEFAVLTRRGNLINASITSGVVCALLICSLIVLLFIGNELEVHVDRVIAALFVLAMVSLAATYAIFLVEIHIAGKSLRADRPLKT